MHSFLLRHYHVDGHTFLNSEESATSSSSSVSATAINIEDKITINDKIELRDPTPDERGKGGVQVVAHDDGNTIKALEVLARIPRNLILASTDISPRIIDAVSEARNITWATGLTATFGTFVSCKLQVGSHRRRDFTCCYEGY